VGLVIGAAIGFNRWLLSITVGRNGTDLGEGLRWAALQALAAYAVHPYVCSAQVGAGDAYHYTLSLADFIRQVRAGVFPVFIGQSEYAFNGGIHTVRTAPYFVHLGALLDALTLHTLPCFAVSNLAIVFSATFGALGAYAALLLYAPKRAMTAVALAALYILSPAILAPLYEGDMIATFMTVPMLPWWVLGLALAADEPMAWRPWLIQGASLAAMWLAHPPIALWSTALTAGAWLFILARERDSATALERMMVAMLLCALLSAYEFASVLTLKISPGPDVQSSAASIVLANIARNWKASLMPVRADGLLLGNIQLGYSLAAAAAVGFLTIGRRRSSPVLFMCMAALLILVVPVPGLTPWLWHHTPHAVYDVTNAWPMQRFYPMLAALAIFAALSPKPRPNPPSERRAAMMAIAFAIGLGWTVSEAQAFFPAREKGVVDPKVSERLFRPENVSLTRVSYMYFGFYPGYFSHSPMDPFLETRLIDVRTMAVLADGSTMINGGRSPGSFKVELTENARGEIEPEIPIKAGETSVLRFDFHGRELEGVLQLSGRTLFRQYRLPQSGAARSFGSGPANGHVISVQNTGTEPDSVRIGFTPDPGQDAGWPKAGNFAGLSVEPQSTGGHMVELRSLIPFHAVARTDRPTLLETPKVFLPDYRARVNGNTVAVVRTGEGLVGVPLGSGWSDVVVDYPGPPILRVAFGTSGLAWLVLAVGAIVMPRADPTGDRLRLWFASEKRVRRMVRVMPFLSLSCALLALCALWTWPRLNTHKEGAIRLVLKLPVGGLHKSEPLVTTGRTGAGDVIYINYLGDDRISVGHDWWGNGAAVSKPFVVDFLVPQIVEVSMRSLSTQKHSGQSPRPSAPAAVLVKWNGREVLNDDAGSYPPGPEDTEIGANLIGASTCVPEFSGVIMESVPIEPWTH
jgi:hypothetical protein